MAIVTYGLRRVRANWRRRAEKTKVVPEVEIGILCSMYLKLEVGRPGFDDRFLLRRTLWAKGGVLNYEE